jgi:hypothetical protein
MATLVVDTVSMPNSALSNSARHSYQSTAPTPGKDKFDFSRISAQSEGLHSVTEDMLSMLP